MLLVLVPVVSAATLSVGADFATVAEAVGAAVDGDTITVPAGTWPEALDFAGKDLLIVGAGSGLTFFAPPAGEDAVTLDGGEVASLTGVSLSPTGGRGVVVHASTLTAADVTIDRGGSTAARGGGIAIDGGTVDLTDVTLTANTAAYGGHIYLTGRSVLTAAHLSLSGGEATYGGAIYADGGSTLSLSDVVSSGAWAARGGGFAWLDGAELDAFDVIVDNPTSDATSGIGYAVLGHSRITIDGGMISGAVGGAANVLGGGMYVGDGSTVLLVDLIVRENVGWSGGGLYVDGSSDVELDGVDFEDNSATEDGGAVRAMESSTLRMAECGLWDNAAVTGGALSLGDGSSLADEGSTYWDNTADEGGAIATDVGTVATLYGTSLSSNVALLRGGAIYVDGGTLSATDLDVLFNEVELGDGGGFSVDGGAVVVTGGRFEGNVANAGDGAGIYSTGALDITSARFSDNEAGGGGGGVWASGSLSVWEGMWFRNHADDDGGAIRATDDVAITRSYLHGNDASNGGAISLYDATAGTLVNLRVTDNLASERGGGIHLSGGATQLDVINNTFAGNEAADDGGHLYTTATVNLVNNLFYQALDGGAVWGAGDAGSDRYYNLVYDNAGGDWLGWSSVTGTSGNLAVDPLLVAYTANGEEDDDNLYLQDGSPAIDAGSPAIFDADGTRSDIGAFGGPDADVQDNDSDGYFDSTDCDDDDARVNPAALEVPYDGIDQDCDGADLDDQDGDGHSATIAGGDDCDDADPAVWPGAAEVWYDGIDEDCSGTSDYDQDGDWHDTVASGGDDCDDLDPTRYGSASEIWYDGIDEDCSGTSDYDRDRDGFDASAYGGADCNDDNAGMFPGNTDIPYNDVDEDCSGDDLVDVDGDGWVAVEAGGTDCNDAEETVYPGAYDDPTDGLDNDCDGIFEWDQDGDGYAALVYGGGDCDDFDAAVNPDAVEVWYDGIDQDCDGRDDDQDGDSYALATDCDDTDPAIHPGAAERFDGLDDDCDGRSELDDLDHDGLNGVLEWLLGTDPLNPDTDGDTLNDGFEVEGGPDRDKDLLIDATDTDDDDDGIATLTEQTTDIDGDGVYDVDVDQDGIINAWDTDADGDGLSDATEGTADDDHDGAPNFLDYQGDLSGGGCGGGSWATFLFLPFWSRRLRNGLAVLLGLAPMRAWAVDAHGFLLMGTSGSATTFTRIGEATAGDPGDWAAGLVIDYARDPLAESFPWGREPIVEGLGTANFAVSYSFGGLVVDGVLPYHAVGVDQAGSFSTPGDARLGVLVPAWKQAGRRPAVALNALGFLPTGSELHYVGAAGPRVGATVTATEEMGPLGFAATAGAQVGFAEEDRKPYGGLSPTLGLGVAYRVTDAMSAAIEATSQSDLSALPVEITASARYRLLAGAWASVGGAAGVGSGVGASRWRAFLGAGWSYRSESRLAVAPPPPVAPAPLAPVLNLDEDGDGVLLAADMCPLDPIRPEQDPRWSDGCPHLAEFEHDHIVITETIFFSEGRADLLPGSEAVLAAVRDVMLAHPEADYFLVEGHTNTNGSDVFNLRLSDARAYAVADWLETHGVTAARLLSKGFGETRPLVPTTDPEAPTVNRRVEFRVVKVDEVPGDARRLASRPQGS